MPKKKTTKPPTPSRAREAAQSRETPSEITVPMVFRGSSPYPDGRASFVLEPPGLDPEKNNFHETSVALRLDRAEVGDFFEEGAAYVVTVKRGPASWKKA